MFSNKIAVIIKFLILYRYFCEKIGLSNPEGLCSAGYFCNGSAINSIQYICPKEHYCPQGSDKPTPCPQGYYSNKEGNENATNCQSCSAGKWCEQNSDTPTTEMDCDAGFICTGGKCVVFVPFIIFVLLLINKKITKWNFILFYCNSFYWLIVIYLFIQIIMEGLCHYNGLAED